MHGILVGAEGKVADEQSVALGAGLVTEATGTVLRTVVALALVVGRTLGRVVQVDGAAVDLLALLVLIGLGGIDSAGELDIAESGTVSMTGSYRLGYGG